MRKSVLAFLVILIMLGSLIVLTPNVSACHSQSTTCSPTEKDITDFNTWSVTYEIDVKLTPGCGSTYWVGFTLGAVLQPFSAKLYKKDDPSKTPIEGSGTPPDANHNNWAGWISVGSGNPVHYYAILEVSCQQGTDNGESATITVDVWSCDNVPNDLEHRVVTTISTVNIPFGIVMSHKVPIKAVQKVRPGNWVDYIISIKDIGEANGPINLSKDIDKTDFKFSNDWEYDFPSTVTIVDVEGTVDFTLSLKPPSAAVDGTSAIFVVKGISQLNSSYKHSIGAKVIVAVAKPDLSVFDDKNYCNIKLCSDDPCDSETINISLDIWNLGEIAVSNFKVTFRLMDIGNEQLIGSITVTDTVDLNQNINIKYPWQAIEGEHSLCVDIDEDKVIPELEEDSNNEAGLVVNVGPAKPKNIVLSMSLTPQSCSPGSEFTVSGDAKYNPEYNSLSLKNTNVDITIKETEKKFSTTTDTSGKYSKVCIAPTDPNPYTIQVKITDGTISAKAEEYLTVSQFQISVLITPTTAITGDPVTISGKVTEKNEGILDADVTILLLDENGVAVGNPANTKTNTMGVYTKEIPAPDVSVYSEFDVDITAIKDNIKGVQKSLLFVDIDTDEDKIGNEEDDDDDGDGYPDIIEIPYEYDPLDKYDAPLPVAEAGLDQSVDEGTSVSFDGGESYSPVGLTLKYNWNFGDDSDPVKDIVTPTHTYDKDGEYTVTLVVSDEYSGSDSITVIITVNDLGPTAVLKGTVSGVENVELKYNATYSTYLEDKITKYEWDFDGDGKFEKTGEEISYPWPKAGTYTVTLQVTDTDGSTDTATLEVTITAKPASEEGGADSGKSTTSNNTPLYVGIVIVIVIVILLALFFMMRKKKPTQTRPTEGRVTAPNIGAQESRRPTTQFADARIKPAMAPPGTVPKQQISTPVQQRSALPPPSTQPQQPPITPGYQTPPQEQRDWSWNFNE